jgi:hypothetical protein
MDDTKPEPADGSQPERGTGQRQDHRPAPPGHEIPSEPDEVDDEEGLGPDEEAEDTQRESA